MITAKQIEEALGLTSVTLYRVGDDAWIEAAEPITPEMQARVQAWVRDGRISTALIQDTDIALQRLKTAERIALFSARRVSAEVDYFITRASSTGIISSADAEFPAAVQQLAAAGIIAEDRWPALLAP
jgi:hypothetical protein